MVILSLFPGIGLLDRAFEDAGFCVVRGPDLLWGGDIRRFHAPAGVFEGVIGGPPCQDFSLARRDEPTGEGVALLAEFGRVVAEAKPMWWLMENVPAVPDLQVAGYTWQRLDVNATQFGSPQRRIRHIQFGDAAGRVLVIDRPAVKILDGEQTVTSKSHDFATAARLQGLPDGYELPGFKTGAAIRAVANGVPYPLALALARAVANLGKGGRVCACGCGRLVTGKGVYSPVAACRKRAQRRREAG